MLLLTKLFFPNLYQIKCMKYIFYNSSIQLSQKKNKRKENETKRKTIFVVALTNMAEKSSVIKTKSNE